MKKLRKLLQQLLPAVFWCLGMTSAYAANHDIGIVPDSTLAHLLLRLELEVSDLEPENRDKLFGQGFRLLDKLTAIARRDIEPTLSRDMSISRREAIKILQAFDQILLSNNFVVSIPVETLSEGLQLRTRVQIGRPIYRMAETDTLADGFYAVDCDLGSILFISLAEAVNIKLYLIEVPNHNFVRWRLDDGTYINWDFNSAQEFTDDQFRNGWSPTARQPFSKDEEIASGYLKDLTPAEVRAYYLGAMGNRAKSEKNYDKAERLFKTSIKTYSAQQLSLNNLSWLYLTVPKFNQDTYHLQAYELSKKVNALNPFSIEYKDTYSCACAAVGKFIEAIEIEKLARNKPKRFNAYRNGKTCLDIGEQ